MTFSKKSNKNKWSASDAVFENKFSIKPLKKKNKLRNKLKNKSKKIVHLYKTFNPLASPEPKEKAITEALYRNIQ